MSDRLRVRVEVEGPGVEFEMAQQVSRGEALPLALLEMARATAELIEPDWQSRVRRGIDGALAAAREAGLLDGVESAEPLASQVALVWQVVRETVRQQRSVLEQVAVSLGLPANHPVERLPEQLDAVLRDWSERVAKLQSGLSVIAEAMQRTMAGPDVVVREAVARIERLERIDRAALTGERSPEEILPGDRVRLVLSEGPDGDGMGGSYVDGEVYRNRTDDELYIETGDALKGEQVDRAQPRRVILLSRPGVHGV